MSQPKWKFVENLGDAAPLDSGGMFLYVDETGVYAPELERVDPLINGRYEIHRVTLERCAVMGSLTPRVVHDVDFATADPDKYEEWFSRSLGEVAQFNGCSLGTIRRELCSEDPRVRATAYQAIYDFHGWENGDQYPLTLTRGEVEARYTDGELS